MTMSTCSMVSSVNKVYFTSYFILIFFFPLAFKELLGITALSREGQAGAMMFPRFQGCGVGGQGRIQGGEKLLSSHRRNPHTSHQPAAFAELLSTYRRVADSSQRRSSMCHAAVSRVVCHIYSKEVFIYSSQPLIF